MIKNSFIFFVTISTLWLATCSGNKSIEAQDSQKDDSVKRVGMVIRLKAKMIEEYKRIHADDHAGVRDLLQKYNMRNFSIFLHQLEDGNYYEFGYYEYTGNNFEEDMKLLAAEPRNKAWLEICEPMQIPLEGAESWTVMERIYYNP
jgi:L-rhamnose mutarotase